MITLYTFGPAFGLPDPSPFVTKAEVLLQLAGLEYRTDAAGFSKAPKGKLPYIDDAGTVVSDSTLIRLHLEARYRIDFDQGLTAFEKGAAWAAEKMCEDQLYWVMARERWADRTNFDKGPRQFFAKVPAPLRPLVIAMVRRRLNATLHGQGIARLAPAEMAQLTGRTVAALSSMLGDKPWLMGARPCGADATVWSFVASGLSEQFECDSRRQLAAHSNLLAYRDRGMEAWYPAIAKG